MFQIQVKIEDLIDELKKVIADQAVEIALIKSKIQVLTKALLRLEKGEKIVTGPAMHSDGTSVETTQVSSMETESVSMNTGTDIISEGDN